MTRTTLTGIDATTPLGFMSALGLLRVVAREAPAVRIGFTPGLVAHPFLDGAPDDLPAFVAADAERLGKETWWKLTYEKQEKAGGKRVADLKAPPKAFSEFLVASIEAWRDGRHEPAALAAAYGTSLARDGKGNTKPTAFHFTAANQQFLASIDECRALVTKEWAVASLFEGNARRPGMNLRWDTAAERNWALRAADPVSDGTSVDAPLEYLAFRGLAYFPCVPKDEVAENRRIATTGVAGRGEKMVFTWPLWSSALSAEVAATVVPSAAFLPPHERRARGVFAACSSSVRRTAQGFGNFGPAIVEP